METLQKQFSSRTGINKCPCSPYVRLEDPVEAAPKVFPRKELRAEAGAEDVGMFVAEERMPAVGTDSPVAECRRRAESPVAD